MNTTKAEYEAWTLTPFMRWLNPSKEWWAKQYDIRVIDEA